VNIFVNPWKNAYLCSLIFHYFINSMKNIVLLFSLLVFVAACKKEEAPAGGGGDAAAAAKKAENIEKYKTVTGIFNTGNWDELDKYIAADYVEHSPNPGQKPGLEGLKEAFKQFKAGFPDFKFTNNFFVADTDVVVVHFTMTGTNTGPMNGMPATNKTMTIDGVDIVRIKDGKAVEHWGYSEEMKMMTQLGMMPPMGEEPAAGGGAPKSDRPSGTPKSEAPTGKPKY
jgi:steroid delta-isomerase-like uncharacterized protein